MHESTVLRWEPARRMWDKGLSRKEIAEFYGISEKALRTRIQKFRREHGWFPPRTQTIP
jgi:uncharacterized protein YjcR